MQNMMFRWSGFTVLYVKYCTYAQFFYRFNQLLLRNISKFILYYREGL